MPTPSSIRRLSPLPLLLIGLAALAVLVLIPWVVYAQDGDATPTNQPATGRPVVLASAEGAPILFADTTYLADGNGLPFTGFLGTVIEFTWSYQWIRVDGETGDETDIGVDSPRYLLVDADIGNLIKVRVSFTDMDSFDEAVTSRPFGPIVEPAGPSRPPSTLVSNTGQSASATVAINEQYAMEFTLGDHGQGYELSSVSIELAAVPSALTVSLWIGDHSSQSSVPEAKLFDFENPSSFVVGLNKFTAPAGVLAYQSVRYHIVLSDFGSSLRIKETTSDAEDAGGEAGAELRDKARVRASGSTGRWGTSVSSRESVLRLAIEGSRRDSGILASNYAQNVADPIEQELVSIGDDCCFRMGVGAADRYLIRGFSWRSDDTTNRAGGITNPWHLREGSSSSGAEQFRLINTRNQAGIVEWTAPQGATVAGGSSKTYTFHWADDFYDYLDDDSGTRTGAVLMRVYGTSSGKTDTPTAQGVTLELHGGLDIGHAERGRPLLAVLGVPLDAMVQNLGQTDDGYLPLGGASSKAGSQGFTTGSDEFGYRFQGIGVNIEGSSSRFPSGPTSVSVAVHADSNGKPGAKLFDLVSPTEFGAGHSFFEAPPGANLKPDTSYVLVWRYNDGAWHRLQVNSSDDEDSGGLTEFSIADTLYVGPDLANLAAQSDGKTMEIAVYGEANTEDPFRVVGIPVARSWLHIPDDVEVGYQFRVVFVTHRGRLPTSGDIDDYNAFVQQEAAGTLVQGEIADPPYTHPVIHRVADQFKAVVCTATVDARTNTGMTGAFGVPIHWMDGGWEDYATLVADTYAEFYSDEWGNTDYGAIVTGNAKTFYQNTKVWTGCDASGVAHPEFPMGNTSAMEMVAVGTPRDPEANHAPLGAVDVDVGFAYHNYFVEYKGEKRERLLPLYAISPIFTVVR